MVRQTRYFYILLEALKRSEQTNCYQQGGGVATLPKSLFKQRINKVFLKCGLSSLSAMSDTKKLNITALPENELVTYLMRKIEVAAKEAITSRGVFLIGLSGGSLINLLAGDKGFTNLQTDWKCWRIFLCDERIVPDSDPESTGGLLQKLLFSKLPDFPAENFLMANISLPSAQDIAIEYERNLRLFWTVEPSCPSYGMADCLLLGLGPDGHTCSLFPTHPALDVHDSWVTFLEDSPKPPPRRLTLTFPFINKAVQVFVIGIGEQKFEIAKRIQDGEDFPIGRVNNPEGHLEWILGTK